MRCHAFELRSVEAIQNAGGETYHTMLRVTPCREGVHGGIFYNVNFRNGKPCGNTKIFDDIIKLARILTCHFFRTAHRKNNFVAPPVRTKAHENRENNRAVENETVSKRRRKNIAHTRYQHQETGDVDPGETRILVVRVVKCCHSQKVVEFENTPEQS